jgi:cytochrome c peroxidase
MTPTLRHRIMRLALTTLLGMALFLGACKRKEDPSGFSHAAIDKTFQGKIDINNPENYAMQVVPTYITKDNGMANPISDRKATIGRVLFYDKLLSADGKTACASCHLQAFAFGDTASQSRGSNGLTGRHSMRLVNARFARENKFFWNERAASLEQQTTMPIQDHTEMGYSGENGDPGIGVLIDKIKGTDYYQELFAWAYGSDDLSFVGEATLQECLAQFVRSIQSFDSKYDKGRAMAPNDGAPFQNFTASENAGKQLFLAPPTFDATGNRISGGLGCGGCHQAPEFDIDPNSRNNGIVGNLSNPAVLDLGNTRSPSLRDLMNPEGQLNGPFMHSANFATLANVIGHYNNILIRPGNTTIDPRLTPNGNPQRLNISTTERSDLIAFLSTLNGTALYSAAKWSNPF